MMAENNQSPITHTHTHTQTQQQQQQQQQQNFFLNVSKVFQVYH